MMEASNLRCNAANQSIKADPLGPQSIAEKVLFHDAHLERLKQLTKSEAKLASSTCSSKVDAVKSPEFQVT
jgi:hypothetical protein